MYIISIKKHIKDLYYLFQIFSSSIFNLYQKPYKNLPEGTTAEKIIKLRKTDNLERPELYYGILGLYHSGFTRFLSGKIMLPYYMYLELKNINLLC